jgi:ribosomal protein S4
MGLNNRYRPQYKSFLKLRENIRGNSKFLNFKKKKWGALVTRLTSLNPYKFFNHSLYQVSRNAKPLKNLHRSNLATKQRLNLFYGKLSDKYLKTVSRRASFKSKLKSTQQGASDLFLNSLETRLDTTLYRAHFVNSVNTAKQWITHGNVYVNNKRITSSNYLLKQGDLIQISSKLHLAIRHQLLKSKLWPRPSTHLEINFKILSIYNNKVISLSNLVGYFPFWLNLKALLSHYQK